MANGGTLLLDEVGELPLGLQSKLLRVLQEGSFEPVGSDRTVRVDVRILAATHVDLEKAIADRRFREDLFYRLSVFPLRLPPLRERLEDLEPLVKALLAEQTRRTGRRGVRVTADGLRGLAAHSWPGNLRELGNVLERGTILAPGRELGPEVLDLPVRPKTEGATLPLPPAAGPSEEEEAWAGGRSSPRAVPTLDEIQRRHIRRVLEITGGRLYGRSGAAALLGLKPTTLQSRMKKLRLSRFGVSYEGPLPPGL
jgi:transcriptional regulator with GAF, ATPase, and Fis domain